MTLQVGVLDMTSSGLTVLSSPWNYFYMNGHMCSLFCINTTDDDDDGDDDDDDDDDVIFPYSAQGT